MVTATINAAGEFDSGSVNVPADSNWHRILTVATPNNPAQPYGLISRNVLPIDLVVGAGGAVNVRLTCTSKAGEVHAPFITDFTQSSFYIKSATTSGGTVNQPAAGAVADYKINTEASAEIGLEVQAVSGATTVRAYGTQEFRRAADFAFD